MAKAKPGRTPFVPSETQRAFVAAAAAVGLPPAMICRMLPPGVKGARATLDPSSLEQHFAEELKPETLLAARLVVARVLERALSGDDRVAISAQMAVFKTLDDWRGLGESAREREGRRLAVDRLTRQERDTLRKLLAKASEDDLSSD
jgi:hypothetical protein